MVTFSYMYIIYFVPVYRHTQTPTTFSCSAPSDPFPLSNYLSFLMLRVRHSGWDRHDWGFVSEWLCHWRGSPPHSLYLCTPGRGGACEPPRPGGMLICCPAQIQRSHSQLSHIFSSALESLLSFLYHHQPNMALRGFPLTSVNFRHQTSIWSYSFIFFTVQCLYGLLTFFFF